ncbi:blue light receptor [Rhizopus azygosporus]|uniref:Blue light receptor n=1 Tax=Rhizopus azygosporus TaxID=86630 RepID=A0A367JT96_RHIAZ|nr:blue light receptor [Rhizopus azygosporus]
MSKIKNSMVALNITIRKYRTKYDTEDSIEETIGVVDEHFRDLPPSTNLNKDPLGLLGNTSTDSGTQRRKEWNQLVLDQTSDFIHVVSLKGVFLYASSSSYVQLEYEPHELIGKSLTSFCHPSDIIPVMREIKEAAHNSNTDRTVNLIFRIRKKHTGYMWIDCKGRLHMDQNRARKCLILCGREYPVYNLSSDQVNLYPEEYWAKLSLAGLFLCVTERCQDIVGFSAESLKHESIFQYAESESITKIAGVLRVIEETRKPTTIEHTLLSSKGSYVPVSSTFYPGDQSPSFILLQVKPIKEGNEEPLIYQIEEPNMFPELDVTRSTNWQYELHQLEQTNEELKEQIERYESSNKSKPRKRSKTKHKQGDLMCAICQTRDSPEWRKGPNGPKELCNACGLRFAKHEKHNKQ